VSFYSRNLSISGERNRNVQDVLVHPALLEPVTGEVKIPFALDGAKPVRRTSNS